MFVCLATKAVHLELVSDLTTSAFVATLRRFIGLMRDSIDDLERSRDELCRSGKGDLQVAPTGRRVCSGGTWILYFQQDSLEVHTRACTAFWGTMGSGG